MTQIVCIHLTNMDSAYLISFERAIFTCGTNLSPVVNFKGIQTSILICWDIEFPEPARELALKGAQLIIVPTANSDPFVSNTTVVCRAWENQVFVAYVNCIGNAGNLNFCGLTTVVGPNGDVLGKATEKHQQRLEQFIILQLITIADSRWILIQRNNAMKST